MMSISFQDRGTHKTDKFKNQLKLLVYLGKTGFIDYFCRTIMKRDIERDFGDRFDKIVDKRYISLFATILEDKNELNPVVPSNINFISWNYDFQLEEAYKSFCDNNRKFSEVFQTFPYALNINSELKVCHINGLSGHFKIGDDSHNLFERYNGASFVDVIRDFGYIADNTSNISFEEFMSYAWEEDNAHAKYNREVAKNILQKTDILVVIGYSFPNFNRLIDKKILSSYNLAEKRLIIQDPNSQDEVVNSIFTNPSFLDNLNSLKEVRYFYFPSI